MALNWTSEVVVNLISAMPYFLSVSLLYQHYRRHKDPILFAFMITWLTYGLYWLSNGIAYIYLNVDIFRLNKGLLMISTISMIIAFNLMMRQNINPLEFSFVVLLNGLIIYSIQDVDSVVIELLDNGDETVAHNGVVRNLIFLLGVYMSIIYLYYTIRIYQTSSQNYKQNALLVLIGAFIFGPLVIFSFMFRLGTYIPGISALLSGLGVLISTIGLQKSPHLIYALSAKAIKLNVVDEESGLTLYTYDFSPDLIGVEDTLISSVIESISNFTQEVLQKGRIKEIILADGVIYISQYTIYRIHFILISNTQSRVLRNNLEVFANSFVEIYGEELDKMTKPVIETSVYESADQFIPEAFPYIPHL